MNHRESIKYTGNPSDSIFSGGSVMDSYKIDREDIARQDETLVHCSLELLHDATLVFPVYFQQNTYQVTSRLNPYLGWLYGYAPPRAF